MLPSLLWDTDLEDDSKGILSMYQFLIFEPLQHVFHEAWCYCEALLNIACSRCTHELWLVSIIQQLSKLTAISPSRRGPS